MSIAPPSQYPVNIGLPPTQPQGSRCTSVITLTSSFLANNTPTGTVEAYDLIMEDSEGLINNIQTMYADLSLCPSPMILTIKNTGQSIFLRQKSQGYYPIACGSEMRIEVCAFTPGGSGYSMKVQFLNVPVSPTVWDAYDEYHPFCVNAQNTTGAALSATTTYLNNPPQYPNTLWPTQWANVWILGFDVGVIGATANSGIQVSLNSVVKAWGGTNIPAYVLQTDAGGNGFLQRSFEPPLVTNGGNANATLNAAAAPGTPTFYTANIYFQLV